MIRLRLVAATLTAVGLERLASRDDLTACDGPGGSDLLIDYVQLPGVGHPSRSERPTG